MSSSRSRIRRLISAIANGPFRLPCIPHAYLSPFCRNAYLQQMHRQTNRHREPNNGQTLGVSHKMRPTIIGFDWRRSHNTQYTATNHTKVDYRLVNVTYNNLFNFIVQQFWSISLQSVLFWSESQCRDSINLYVTKTSKCVDAIKKTARCANEMVAPGAESFKSSSSSSISSSRMRRAERQTTLSLDSDRQTDGQRETGG